MKIPFLFWHQVRECVCTRVDSTHNESRWYKIGCVIKILFKKCWVNQVIFFLFICVVLRRAKICFLGEIKIFVSERSDIFMNHLVLINVFLKNENQTIVFESERDNNQIRVNKIQLKRITHFIMQLKCSFACQLSLII